jgi:hypothetical protein
VEVKIPLRPGEYAGELHKSRHRDQTRRQPPPIAFGDAGQAAGDFSEERHAGHFLSQIKTTVPFRTQGSAKKVWNHTGRRDFCQENVPRVGIGLVRKNFSGTRDFLIHLDYAIGTVFRSLFVTL